jgi:hypothetical protein
VHARKPIAAVAAVMFALGVIAATVIDRPFDRSNPPSASGPRNGPNQGGSANVPLDDGTGALNADRANAVRSQSTFATGDSFVSGPARTGAGAGGQNGNGAGDGTGSNPPGQTPPGSGNEPGNPPQTDVLGMQLLAPGLSTAASVEVGGDCTGLNVLGVLATGCQPPPTDKSLAVRTSGLLGNNEIGLP